MVAFNQLDLYYVIVGVKMIEFPKPTFDKYGVVLSSRLPRLFSGDPSKKWVYKQMDFKDYYKIYTYSGFKALKCRGYDKTCPTTSKDLRNNAKIPVTKGYSKKEFLGLTLEDCEKWMKTGGWIGWLIPENIIVLDVDKDNAHIEQINELIKVNKLNIPIHNTKNGKHYLFKTDKTFTANTAALIKLGFNVTYRIGGKSQLILCPMEPERNWINIDALKDPSTIDILLTPLEIKKKEEVLYAINTQLSYYYSIGLLSGVDIDFSYAGFLVDECEINEEMFVILFEILFDGEFDEDQTRLMYNRAKTKEVKQSTGTLMQILQDKNLKHIIFLINSIEKLTKKSKSPEQLILQKNEVVQYFNKQHSIVDLGGKISVMKEVYNNELKRNERIFYDFPNFKRKYQSLPSVFINKKPVPQTEIWFDSEDRREYDSIDYVPGKDTEHLKVYNIWTGFSVEPLEGSCEKFLDHIRQIVSSDNDEIYNYILNWMADAVQNLRSRPGVSIVMTGRQGVGKGIFASNFGQLFGEHFLHIGRANALVGNFNSELMGKSLVFADEAFWGGDKQIAGILKSMITENELRIEFKGKEPVYVRNHIRIIAASNNDRVVPAEMGERRFFVVDVSSEKKQDFKYFQTIQKEMDDGGRGALLKFLLERDISSVDIREFPKTTALVNQKIYNLSSVDTFLYEFLDCGDLDVFVKGLTSINQRDDDYFRNNFNKLTSDSWPTSLPSQFFFKIYLWWAKEMNERHAIKSVQSFGQKIKAGINVECKRVKHKDQWVRGYEFLPLEETRESFEGHLGQKVFNIEKSDDIGLVE